MKNIDIELTITDEAQLNRIRTFLEQLKICRESENDYIVNGGRILLTNKKPGRWIIELLNIPGQLIDDVSRALYGNVIRIIPSNEIMEYR